MVDTPEPGRPRYSQTEVVARRRRLLFFAVSGTLLLGTLIVFREVLLPFVLAIVVAYVLAPIVKPVTRVLPRWLAVLVLYLALLGALAAFIAYGVPRLAAEVEKLAREAPRTARTIQREWLPNLELRFRKAVAAYSSAGSSGQPERPPEAAARARRRSRPARGTPTGGMDGGVPASSRAILVTPVARGGYQVHLPPGGIHVRPEGEANRRTYRVGAEDRKPTGQRDVTATITEAIQRQFRNSQEHAVTVFQTVQAVATGLVRGVFGFFIMLMISAYLLLTADRIFGFFRSLARPDKRDRFDQLLKRIDHGLSGVIRGQLLIALVNGVLSGIGFYLFDLKYWPILTLIATVLSIIPIFGAIISSVPAVLIGLQDSFVTALLVLAWIVGIHQLEANVLNPKIMGDAAKVHPVLVVFALLAGEHVFGVMGALLAVPVLSISQSLFLHYREVALGASPSPEATG